MMNIVIFGAPGSGKGTQSEKLIEKYGLHHISTGELLRDHIAKGTNIGKLADSYISNGQLIPDEVMIEVLENEFKENAHNTSKGVIFDGFPRTIPQAKALSEMLKGYGTDVHAVVGLEVDEEELVKRMIERGKSSGRADDNLDTIRKRLDVYHKQTAPLQEFYKDLGKYNPIKGSGAVEVIFGDIVSALEPHKDKK
ncbi:MAG: adenylate kinase [Bacteroidales bacterium]|nr:adenylate kinase [Bacteroidales bacterium]